MHTVKTLLVAASALLPLTVGHTWVDQLRNIGDKGEYVGDAGYSRHKVIQTDKEWSYFPNQPGTGMQNLVPAASEKSSFISANSSACHPLQKEAKQTANYPRLKAVPGKYIAMRYLENGHVTLVGVGSNAQKDPNNGTVFIYGTTQPKTDEKLADVLQWTEDGQGGDKRGVLLTAQNFDDGRCHQVNSSPMAKARAQKLPDYAAGQDNGQASEYELPCESNVMLPKNATVGKAYTMYWVWQWGSTAEAVPPRGMDEYYTTCMDVDVVSSINATAKLAHPMYQQDSMDKAVSNFKSRTVMKGYGDAIKGERGTIFEKLVGGSSSAGGSASATPKPSHKSTSKPGASPTTLSTVKTSAAGNKPTASATVSDGIPMMTTRPGRPLTTTSAAANDDGEVVVTIVSTVHVTTTVDGPAETVTVTAPARAKRGLTHGAKFRVNY